MNGILLIDKPTGMTSHDVVDKVRKKLSIRKVGHAGTLDPLATGLLIILVGRATKLSEKLMGLDKQYRATLQLGVTTDTLDIDGKVLEERDVDVKQSQIENALKKFEGEFEQTVPAYSAVKVNGMKLYEYARKGLAVPAPKRLVCIDWIKLKDFNAPLATIALKCSKGTYVRQLAQDVGRQLDCGACIYALRREVIGSFRINEAQTIEGFNESHIRDWSTYQAA